MADDSYYNTTRVTGAQLRQYIESAKGQEAETLKFFLRHSSELLTPEDVNRLVLPTAPRHSISRVMRNLTRAGFLEKTIHQTYGEYGRPIHYWRLGKIDNLLSVQEAMF